MPSYILAVIDYRASDNNGAFEWSITGAHGQQPTTGRGTITGNGVAAPLTV